MRKKLLTSRLTKLLALIVVAGLLLSVRQPTVSGVVFAADPSAGKLAFDERTLPADGSLNGRILSNGQFVYGPNVGVFNLAVYLQGNAPHLTGLAESLYGRADYFSINPKVYLTLFEVTAHLLADPDPARLDDPFGLGGDFIAQVDQLSETLVNAYYLHLYTYSQLPVDQRVLPPLTSRDGVSLAVDPDTNAGSYAIMAGLAELVNGDQLVALLDIDQPAGFTHTWLRLFPDDDPLDESNHIYHPGEISAVGAPNELLQLPYPVGESWKPNGVHDSAGGGDGTPFTDGASIDFSPTWPAWNTDTSQMWAVAAASGTPNRVSSCSFRITHADGWATSYYHLDNIQSFSGWINRNDRIGILANTYEQATCNGGFSTGPHLHFSLRHNGALVAIDGTPLSGWYVHAGRWNYDYDRSYFWLERDGVKSYAFQPLLSEDQLLITHVVSGGSHTCALTDRGTIKCWGDNGGGQLGDGTNHDRLSPVDVQGLSAPAIKIAAGRQHTCALLNDGSVVCWGENGDGQLGDGTSDDSTSPQAVSGLSSGVTGITAGGGHSCALTADGSVNCWGDNASGQLGSGDNDPSLVPVPVSGLDDVQDLAAGSDHSCALDINGAVMCWGDNSFGQLGDGSNDGTDLPVQVSGLGSGVHALTTHGGHVCALNVSGELICWGLNSDGQLGDGTTENKNVPTAANAAGSGLHQVSTGMEFSCILVSNRAVQCYGDNTRGQLGNGSTDASLVPVNVTGLGGSVLQISAGDAHACALSTDGKVRCWGANTSGQLGDGGGLDQSEPVLVENLTHTLIYIKEGSGSGRVSSSPAGIDCNANCSGTFLAGENVTLTGVAASGSTFTSWSGGLCSGTAPCTVRLSESGSITATFTANAYTLSIIKSGSGTITSSPVGLNCGPVCSYSYPYNTTISLYTAATPGSNFSSWGGDCSGGGSCSLLLDGDKTINANFVYDINTLDVSKSGDGTVTSSPAGIDCGAECSAAFTYPTTVNLTATPLSGSIFSGWSGYCSGLGVCSLPMTSSRSVTANFAPGADILTVSKTGSGSGTVTSNPSGINCGSTCAANFTENTQVTLAASPSSNLDRFIGWSGACSGMGICTVTMSESRTVAAGFERAAFDDVPFDYSEVLGGVTYNLHAYIQVLLDNGLTVGTSTEPPLYSPGMLLDRSMAAVFMLRAQYGMEYKPPLEPFDAFGADDWSLNSWARSWAEGMWDVGLTAGCQSEPLKYCPDDTLPRVQAVIFGLRMKYDTFDGQGQLLAYEPPPATGLVFADMTDVGYYGTAWAEQAYLDGLLPICGTQDGKPLFCPEDPVDRAWAAYLIVMAQGLPLP